MYLISNIFNHCHGMASLNDSCAPTSLHTPKNFWSVFSACWVAYNVRSNLYTPFSNGLSVTFYDEIIQPWASLKTFVSRLQIFPIKTHLFHATPHLDTLSWQPNISNRFSQSNEAQHIHLHPIKRQNNWVWVSQLEHFQKK